MKADKFASAEIGRVTVIVYVLVVVPSSEVPTTVITLSPKLKLIAPDAVPEVTAVPLTVIVAKALLRVGVTVIELVALVTVAVYAVVAEANVGDRVPEEIARADKVESLE